MAVLDCDGPILDRAFFRSLNVVADGSMQSYKSAQLAKMRDQIRADRTGAPASAGVMLLRGGSGRRRILVNEGELAQALLVRGFTIVDPMTTTVEGIAAACANAEVVVGVEGSQMVHGLLALAPGASFITIQPPFKFDNTCKPYCDALGIKYAFTVGLDAEGGFSVELDRVLAIIDKTTAAPLHKASYAR
jgi:capsular polysaccharide biosynthesis protein